MARFPFSRLSQCVLLAIFAHACEPALANPATQTTDSSSTTQASKVVQEVTPFDLYDAKLNNLFVNNPLLITQMNVFLNDKLFSPYSGRAIDFNDYKNLFINEFYASLLVSASLENNSFTSPELSNYLNVVKTCDEAIDNLDRQQLQSLDSKYSQLCSKAKTIYALSGETDSYVEAYAFYAAMQSGKLTLSSNDPAYTKYQLPSFSHYAAKIFPRLKHNLRITVIDTSLVAPAADKGKSQTEKND